MRRVHCYYDNLKVARDAPDAVIRAAYRALAQQYHPDKNPDSADAARVMKLINEAYAALSDPAKRRDHDSWIAAHEAKGFASAASPSGQPPPEARRPGWRPSDQLARRGPSKTLGWLVGIVVAGFALNGLFSVGWRGSPTDSARSSPPQSQPMTSSTSVDATPIASFDDRPQGWPTAAQRFAPEVLDDELQNAVNRVPELRLWQSSAEHQDKWRAAKAVDALLSRSPKWRDKPLAERFVAAVALVKKQIAVPSKAPIATPDTEQQSRSGYVPGAPRTATGGLSTFTVDNAKGGEDSVVRLYLEGKKPEVRAFYVKLGEKFTAKSLSPGTYLMRYRFIGSTDTYEADKQFVLTERETEEGRRFSNVTVTLFRQRDGNLSTRKVPPEEF